MSTEIDANETLDVKGLNCPMPVVQTKGAVDDLEPGEVLEVVATDPGSMSDLDGWADGTDGVTMLTQEEDGDTFRHYVRKEE
jgi:TusA-related sulfurtransferase